jgi:dTMP kinase
MLERGYFISFEGIDGAGKSTQVKLLHDYLVGRGIPTLMTHEPGGTTLGRELRYLLMSADAKMDPLAAMFLYQADRAQHFETVVIPHLVMGDMVLTDRCYDSTVVYQGYGHGIDPKLIDHISLLAMHGFMPQLTIYLDLDPALVWQRKRDNNPLSYDWAPAAFHERLRAAYVDRKTKDPDRIKAIRADQPQEKVHAEVVRHVEELFARRHHD